MKFCSVSTGKEWVDLPSTPAEDDASRGALIGFNKAITEVLHSENLIVLAGLGTSLCVQDPLGIISAPTMLDLWNAAKSKSGKHFSKLLSDVKFDETKSGKNIELLLSLCQSFQRFNSSTVVDSFIIETENLIIEKCSFINSISDLSIHEAFLRKAARRSTRLPRMKLFTTNYDLSFETAAGNSRFVVVDGFSHTLPQEFDGSYYEYDLIVRNSHRETTDYVPNVFHPYKLHGSLDWERDTNQVLKKTGTKTPLIIYPRDSKFESSYSQPYLEMMSRFQSALRLPNTGILILGFGFNDQHISQPILQAIKSNISSKTLIVAPDLQSTSNSTIAELKSLISTGDSRISFAGMKFEEFVPIIPDFVAKTELEYHYERIRGVPTNA